MLKALGKFDYGLLVLIALPILLLIANNNWVFINPLDNWIDPWFYTAYFMDFSQHSAVFAGTYYGSRLGWIIPGVISYKIFPPLIAHYVLHFSFYYAALFSFYLILKNTINQKSALFGSLLIGSYSYFIWPLGMDYVDGAGITYFLLATVMFTYAAKSSKWKVFLFFGGIFFALMVYTNILLVTFAPPLIFYYLLINYKWRKNSFFIGTILFIFGIFIITTLLGFISYSVNKNFLFFLPSLQWALGSINKSVPVKDPSYAFILKAPWLMVPFFTFIGSIIFLIIKLKKESINKDFSYIFQLFYIMVFSIIIIWQMKGSAMLEIQYYASYLIPGMFLAFGSWFANAFNNFTSKQFLFFISCATALVVFPYTLFNSPIVSGISSYSVITTPKYKYLLIFPIILSLLLFYFIIFGYRIKKRLLFLVILSITFSIMNFSIADMRLVGSPLYPRSELFLSVVKSMQTMQSFDKEIQGSTWFWYNSKEPLVGNLYRPVASLYLWGYRLVNEEFPDTKNGICDVSGWQINSLKYIAILSTDKNALQLADQALNKINLKAKYIFEKTIQQGEISFNMLFIKVENKKDDVSSLSVTTDKADISIKEKEATVSIKEEIKGLFYLVKNFMAGLFSKWIKYFVILFFFLVLICMEIVFKKYKKLNTGKSILLKGIMRIGFAFAAYLWVRGHSPENAMFGVWVFPGIVYFIIIWGTYMLAIFGIMDTYNGWKGFSKKEREEIIKKPE